MQAMGGMPRQASIHFEQQIVTLRGYDLEIRLRG